MLGLVKHNCMAYGGSLGLMDLRRTYAVNLKAAMDYRGLTQGDIKRRTGIAQSTVGRALSASHAPDLDTISRIADAVGFQPWQLMVPGFNPSHPPFIPRLTEQERALYDKFKTLLNSGSK